MAKQNKGAGKHDDHTARMMAAPIVELLGVVAPRGATAARAGDERLWSLNVEFTVWRVAGAEIRNEPIAITRKVEEGETSPLMAQFKPYDVMSIRSRLGEYADGRPRAYLEEVLGNDTSDAELQRLAHELQKPVTLDDPMFGAFTLNRQVDWYEAEVSWQGKKIQLTLSDSSETEDALETAHALWQDEDDWAERIQSFAVEDLLPLKNEYWLEEDEAEVTAEEFLERMTLDSIDIGAEGEFTFWHGDGDLFRGHSIQIMGNLVDGPTDSDIPG